MKTTSAKNRENVKSGPSGAQAPKSDRATLIALYLFTAGMLLSILYFISLIFVL